MAETASELARLKDLLLRPEANRLERLQATVDSLDERLGSKARLEIATADILVDAFRQTEVRQHRELARAVAPVVVAAIQSEIRNSRDMMVEALYPITGRLVAAAVADAFRSLVTTINQRVDTMMSMRLWRLRIKAWLTRRPFSELLLAVASRPHLRRILFLERGSGALLGSWADDPNGNERSDLVSGMIAAITEFSSSAFEHQSGELRTIDMGASRILLHTSARTITAGEFTGPLHPGDEQAAHEIFARLAEHHDETAPAHSDELAHAAQQINALTEPADASKGSNLGIWIVLALLLAIAGYFTWRTWARTSFENTIQSAFAAEVQSRPLTKAYPLSLRIDHDTRQISLSGLAPSPEDAEAMRKAVQAKVADYNLQSDIAIVVSQDAAARGMTQMQAQVQTLQSSLQTTIEAQTKALSGVNAELEKLRQSLQGQQPVIADINTQIGALSNTVESRIQELQKLTSDPRVMAERFMQRNAIFFDHDAVLRDPAIAAKTIETLATMLRAANMKIRVVGYSSESGSNAINRRVAQERTALLVRMLGEQGIEAARIVVATRPIANPIDDSADGNGNSNRRVEFEPLFEGEKPAP